MGVNLEYLEMCRKIQMQIYEAKRILSEATIPLSTDMRLVEPIIRKVGVLMGDEKQTVVARAQVFIVLYIFAPAKMTNKERFVSHVFSELVRVIGVDKGTISRYKSESIDYYKFNRGFRNKIDVVYRAIESEFLIK